MTFINHFQMVFVDAADDFFIAVTLSWIAVKEAQTISDIAQHLCMWNYFWKIACNNLAWRISVYMQIITLMNWLDEKKNMKKKTNPKTVSMKWLMKHQHLQMIPLWEFQKHIATKMRPYVKHWPRLEVAENASTYTYNTGQQTYHIQRIFSVFLPSISLVY